MLEGIHQGQRSESFTGDDALGWLAADYRRLQNTQSVQPREQMTANERAVEDAHATKAHDWALQQAQALLDAGLITADARGLTKFAAGNISYEFSDRFMSWVQSQEQKTEKGGFSSFSSFAARKWTLRSVMADPNVFAVFCAFVKKADMKRVYVDCLRDIEEYQRKHSLDAGEPEDMLKALNNMRQHAQELWDRHFAIELEDIVELDDDQRAALQNTLESDQSSYEQVYNAFNTAKALCQNVVQTEHLSSFLASLGLAAAPASRSPSGSPGRSSEFARGSGRSSPRQLGRSGSGRSLSGGSGTSTPSRSRDLGVQGESADERRERLKRRRRVATEILTTEESYVDSLKQLLKWYLVPLKKMCKLGQHKAPEATKTWKKNIIKEEEYEQLAANVDTIAELNQLFAEDLSRRISEWSASDESQQVLSDVFLKFGQLFRMYHVYSDAYASGSQLLQQLLDEGGKNKAFIKWHAEVMSLHDAESLASLLIRPIQRIPRYVLLLAELRKNTQPHQPEYVRLGDAIDVLRETADFINESIRGMERAKVITSIEEQFKDASFHARGRYFVRQGLLTQLNKKGAKIPLLVFLFNDLLVYVDAPGKKAKKFKEYKSIDVTPEFYMVDVPDDDEKEFAMQMTHQNKSLLVLAENNDDKGKWMRDIQLVIKEQELLAQEADGELDVDEELERSALEDGSVQLEKFQAGARCFVCILPLNDTGKPPIQNCSNCGRLCHVRCSSSNVTLDSSKGPEPVCDDCYPKIQSRKRYGQAFKQRKPRKSTSQSRLLRLPGDSGSLQGSKSLSNSGTPASSADAAAMQQQREQQENERAAKRQASLKRESVGTGLALTGAVPVGAAAKVLFAEEAKALHSDDDLDHAQGGPPASIEPSSSFQVRASEEVRSHLERQPSKEEVASGVHAVERAGSRTDKDRLIVLDLKPEHQRSVSGNIPPLGQIVIEEPSESEVAVSALPQEAAPSKDSKDSKESMRVRAAAKKKAREVKEAADRRDAASTEEMENPISTTFAVAVSAELPQREVEHVRLKSLENAIDLETSEDTGVLDGKHDGGTDGDSSEKADGGLANGSVKDEVEDEASDDDTMEAMNSILSDAKSRNAAVVETSGDTEAVRDAPHVEKAPEAVPIEDAGEVKRKSAKDKDSCTRSVCSQADDCIIV